MRIFLSAVRNVTDIMNHIQIKNLLSAILTEFTKQLSDSIKMNMAELFSTKESLNTIPAYGITDFIP